jgi:hypothetical protein
MRRRAKACRVQGAGRRPETACRVQGAECRPETACRVQGAECRGEATWLILVALMLGSSGCFIGMSSGSAGVQRPAEDVPNHFEPRDPNARMMPADTIAGAGCLSPMVDPRDGTEIGFLRSAEGYADYAVPGRLYGVGSGELLRLECNTGKVLGIVRR